VTHFSGNWNNDSHTGDFYWNLNNASDDVNRNNGTHLLVWLRIVQSFYLPHLLVKQITCQNNCISRETESSVDTQAKE